MLFTVLLLLAGGMVLFVAEGGENDMGHAAQLASEKGAVPLVDRTLPARTETATFGLG